VNDCLDADMDFDVEGLFSTEEESENSESPTLREFVDLDVDLLLRTSPFADGSTILPIPLPWTPIPQFDVIRTFASILISFMTSMQEPLVPYRLHNACLSSGYQTIYQVKGFVKTLHEIHQDILLYIVSFLRDYRSMSITDDLTLDSVADVLVTPTFGPYRQKKTAAGEEDHEKSRTMLREKLFLIHLLDPKNSIL
jgi:hypothetical protein